MNDFQKLVQALRAHSPALELELDDSPTQGETCWLDIRRGDRWVVVEWRPQRGFGISLLEEPSLDSLQGMFEGPDDVVSSVETARERIVSFLDSDEPSILLRRKAAGY